MTHPPSKTCAWTPSAGRQLAWRRLSLRGLPTALRVRPAADSDEGITVLIETFACGFNRSMQHTFQIAVAVFSLLFSAQAHADMPSMKRTKTEQTTPFGDIKIKQSFNSTRDPMSPEFKLQLYNKGKLLLQLNDAAFDAFYAAPGGEAFVGLSNGGWPDTAVIIFDRSGRILLLARHSLARFRYCRETSTFLREWYDAKDPQVRFPQYQAGQDRPPGITIRDCRGQTVDLLDTVSKAAEGSAALLRSEIHSRYGTR
jgi:hypothetical protein